MTEKQLQDFCKNSLTQKDLKKSEKKLLDFVKLLNIKEQVAKVFEQQQQNTKIEKFKAQQNTKIENFKAQQQQKQFIITKNKTKIPKRLDHVILKYSSDGKDFIEQYTNQNAALDQYQHLGPPPTKQSLMAAVKNNSLFESFRWAKNLNNHFINNKFEELDETNFKRKSKRMRHIAMLDVNNDKIIQQFISQSAAEKHTKIEQTGISDAVNQKKTTKGHRFGGYCWKYWDDCATEKKILYEIEGGSLKGESNHPSAQSFKGTDQKSNTKIYNSLGMIEKELNCNRDTFLHHFYKRKIFKGCVWEKYK